MAAAEVVGLTVGVLLIARLSRRTLLAGSCAVCAVTVACFAGVSSSGGGWPTVVHHRRRPHVPSL